MEISSNLSQNTQPIVQTNKINNAAIFPEILKTTATNVYAIAPNEHLNQLQKDKCPKDKTFSDSELEDDEPSIRDQVTTIIKKIKQLKKSETNKWNL